VVAYKGRRGELSLAGNQSFAPAFDALGMIARHVQGTQWLRWALLGIPASASDLTAFREDQKLFTMTRWVESRLLQS
jgi:Asp-tRNA(Asn)/Glu-tRNA(Gln) amidotransferase A subunit family amidase